MQLEKCICSFLGVNTDIGCLQTTCDNAEGWDAAVLLVPSAAMAGVKGIAGSTCYAGQTPQVALPPSSCQQNLGISSSPAVGRFQSAPQLVKQRKRKGAIDLYNYKGNVQTCQLYKAQAKLRKSLRRGFLLPLGAQGCGEEHVNSCEATGGHPARSQVMLCSVVDLLLDAEDVAHTLSLTVVFESWLSMGCYLRWLARPPPRLGNSYGCTLQADASYDTWQACDTELQASQIQAERNKADMLACREEAAWLRSRVCQLQQIKHARDSAAAQGAVLPLNHVVERQALQQRWQFHANICPQSAAT